MCGELDEGVADDVMMPAGAPVTLVLPRSLCPPGTHHLVSHTVLFRLSPPPLFFLFLFFQK